MCCSQTETVKLRQLFHQTTEGIDCWHRIHTTWGLSDRYTGEATCMTVIHVLLGSVSMVFTIYGFSSVIYIVYSSPTEPFSAQAPPNMPCMTLLIIAILLHGATQFAGYEQQRPKKMLCIQSNVAYHILRRLQFHSAYRHSTLTALLYGHVPLESVTMVACTHTSTQIHTHTE